MSDHPVKKQRLRVVDVPSSTTVRRPSRSTSNSSRDSEFSVPRGERKKRNEKEFERQTVAKRTSPEGVRWDEATSGITSIHGRPFSPERNYSEQDIVLHKKLGLGIVEDVAADGSTMNVLFRDGITALELESQ